MSKLIILCCLFIEIVALEVNFDTQNVQEVYNKLTSPILTKKLFKNKITAEEVKKIYNVEVDKSAKDYKSTSEKKETKLEILQSDMKIVKNLQSVMTRDSFSSDKKHASKILQELLFSQYNNVAIPIEFVYIVEFNDNEDDALNELMNQLTVKALSKYGMSHTKYNQELVDMNLKSEMITVNMYGTLEKNQSSSFSNKRLYTANTTILSGVISANFYPFKLHNKHYSEKTVSSSLNQTKGLSIKLLNLRDEKRLSKFIDKLPEKSIEKINRESKKNITKQKSVLVSYGNIRNQLKKDTKHYLNLINTLFAKYTTCKNLNCIQKTIRDQINELKDINYGKSVIFLKGLPDIKYEYAIDVVVKEIVKELERSTKVYATDINEKLSSGEYQQKQINISTKPLYEKADIQLYYKQNELGILIKFYFSYDSNLLCLNFVKDVNYDHLLDMKFIKVQNKFTNKYLYMLEKEVTQKIFFKFMNKKDIVKNCPMEQISNNPVSCVTPNVVKKFIKKLNKENKQFRYRLPTCDEWLFIATCENKQKYCWGSTEDYKEYENISTSKYEFEISSVGSLNQNALGLYDMCGNVREICKYNGRTKSVGSSHYSLEPIVSKYRLGPSSGFRIVKEER